MIDIDGSLQSGSGTIVRCSIALASLLGREIRIRNIRSKRSRPGLRPQHLKAVQACCDITGGRTDDAQVGSSSVHYFPGKAIRGGSFCWDIGTAGSATMMALCLLPLSFFAENNSTYTISGGLFQDFAPNAFHMKHVLLKLLKHFSVHADMEIVKPGYVPSGGGILTITAAAVSGKLEPLQLQNQGKVTAIRGIAVSSHLRERRVSERMRDACLKVLNREGYKGEIEIINDISAQQKGAALFLYALTDTGCIIGSDRAGKPGRTSEEIGRHAAQTLVEDIRTGATVDRFTADQLIPFAALAEGESTYIIPRLTGHIESNLWIVEKLLGARSTLKKNVLRIHGIGFIKE